MKPKVYIETSVISYLTSRLSAIADLVGCVGCIFIFKWNCKHIANAIIRREIERICRSQGYEPVTICTPEELIER